MKSVFRGELFRLSRSAVLLLAIVVLLVCDLFISSRSKVTETNMYDLAELPGAGTFVNYFQDNKTSPEGAAARMRLPRVKNQPETIVLRDDPATAKYENLIEVYWACSPYYFRWVLASNQGLMVIPLIFAVMFLARDFPNRVFNDSLYIGKRRREIFWGKTLFYFLLAFLISLAGILLLALVYASAVFRTLPAGYVWSRILLHAFVDTCLMAVPFLLAFLTRNPVVTGILSALYGVLIRYTGLIYPAKLKADMAAWEQGTFPLTMALICLAVLAVCIAVSRLLFEKQDIK
ncbi:MAG: hypothetical protein IKG89_05320 [Oscillospiraceae bacterium]|nr:hypothetical protein [Oscillospiraceae bacterium]